MKKLFLILMVLCMPAIVNAQAEVDNIIEGRVYSIKLHPYYRLLFPDKVEIVLLADHNVEVINWSGSGTWTYTANSQRRFLMQYTGEFEESGILLYLNLTGRSNFLGRIWGTGFCSIGNPSDPSPTPVPCYFTGSAK